MLHYSMTILGIDPGSAIIGWGIIENSPAGGGGALKLIDFGTINFPPKTAQSEKLAAIEKNIADLIAKHRPGIMAIEKIFFFKNAKTVIAVAEARGVILLAAAKAGVDISEHTPLQIKQAVSAYGRAGKTQIQNMVKLILNLKEAPRQDDAADALACAICCANSINSQLTTHNLQQR